MARYIDVEPLINWLESEINSFGEPNISIRPVAFGTERALQSVLGFVNSQPTADVAEVRHGEWKKAQFVQRSGFRTVRDYICRICGKVYAIEQPCNLMNYCPHCGAKMNLSELPTD